MDALEKETRVADVLDHVAEDAHVISFFRRQSADFATDDFGAGNVRQLAARNVTSMGRVFDARHGQTSRSRADEEVALAATNLQQVSGRLSAIPFQKIEVDLGGGLLELVDVALTGFALAENEIVLA